MCPLHLTLFPVMSKSGAVISVGQKDPNVAFTILPLERRKNTCERGKTRDSPFRPERSEASRARRG